MSSMMTVAAPIPQREGNRETCLEGKETKEEPRKAKLNILF